MAAKDLKLSSPGKPCISLVVPAYNEEHFLGDTLASVAEAAAALNDPSRIEVIVADNGSSDGTVSVAREAGVKVVFEERRCIASVRNRGAAGAAGEIIGFLDADSRVTSNIFTEIHAAMASGIYIGGGTDIKIDRRSLGIFCTYFITKYPAMWFWGITGGLIFTSAKTFHEMGGFDESLYCGEDMHFILDLKKYGKEKGQRFKVVKNAHVVSSARAFDRFGEWYYFRNLPRIIGKHSFHDKSFCDQFWYENRR